MTTQYSPTVQRIIDISNQAAIIGNDYAMRIVANAPAGITQADKDGLIKIMEKNIAIQSDLLAWVEAGRTFETWVPVFEAAQLGIDFDAIDPTGKLRELSDMTWAREDLKAYYDEVIVGLELDDISMNIFIFKESLAFVKGLKVIV